MISPNSFDWRYLYRLVHRAADGLPIESPTTEDFQRYFEYELRKSKYQARTSPNGDAGPDFAAQTVAIDVAVGDLTDSSTLERYVADGYDAALAVHFDPAKRKLKFARSWKDGRPDHVQRQRASTPPLTHAEYRAILEALDRRDALLARVLRSTGLQISDTLRVTGSQFCLNGSDYTLLLADPVILPPALGADLAAYIAYRGLMAGARIWPISRVQAWRIIYTAGRKALDRGVRPKEFRVLYFNTLLDGGVTDYLALTAEQRAEIQRRMPA